MFLDEGNKIEVSLHTASYFQLLNALSYAYQYALTSKMDLDVDVLWSSKCVDSNFNFQNCDELESFLEKFDYIDAMMEFPERPTVHFNHIVVDGLSVFSKQKAEFSKKCRDVNYKRIKKIKSDVDAKAMHWPLKNNLKKIKNKVAFWKPTFTHKMMGESEDTPWVGTQSAKGMYTYHEFEKIKHNFQRLGYNVVELEYRLPVRDIYYHLSTSEFSFGYNGLCQNISVCLGTPTILLTWKKSMNLLYDYLMPKVDPQMFADQNFLNFHIDKAKNKISSFKPFYEHLYWSWK